MRAFGLLFLLGGALVLLAPTFAELLNRYYYFRDGPIMGGALICLGLAALVLSRNRA